ncbi:hypothetical protein M3J09_010285 [Ascochyta lentis]
MIAKYVLLFLSVQSPALAMLRAAPADSRRRCPRCRASEIQLFAMLRFAVLSESIRKHLTMYSTTDLTTNE